MQHTEAQKTVTQGVIMMTTKRPPPWRKLATGLALFLLLRHTVTFSSSDVTYTFTLVNRTPHFLHTVINNSSHAYLPPGGTLDARIRAYALAVVDVRYSPGQGMQGKASRVFESECHTTTSSTSTTSTDCNQSSPDCGESTSSGTSTSQTTCSPVVWMVFPADMDSTAAGGGR